MYFVIISLIINLISLDSLAGTSVLVFDIFGFTSGDICSRINLNGCIKLAAGVYCYCYEVHWKSTDEIYIFLLIK